MIDECPICDRELGLDEEDHIGRCLDKRIAAAVAKEREALVAGLEYLIASGHAEETNLDVALRHARTAGIREAQDAIRARKEAGG